MGRDKLSTAILVVKNAEKQRHILEILTCSCPLGNKNIHRMCRVTFLSIHLGFKNVEQVQQVKPYLFLADFSEWLLKVFVKQKMVYAAKDSFTKEQNIIQPNQSAKALFIYRPSSWVYQYLSS